MGRGVMAGWAVLALASPSAVSAQRSPDAPPDRPAVAVADTASGPGDTRRPARSSLRRPPSGDEAPSALTADTRRPPPPGLIGDWHAIRTRLARRGIGVTARYASETAYNVTGGDSRLVRETGQFDAGVLLDLEKVAGLRGGAFQGTITYRRGRNLSDDARLGTLQQVQEVYGRGQTLRLTQAWYEQAIGGGVELKLGLTNPGEDFAAFSCHFMNLSFCGAQPGNLAGDYWYNWPVSQWGARLRVAVGDAGYVAGGLYQINPRNLAAHVFLAHLAGGTGVLMPLEAGWIRTNGRGHIASYKVGGWIGTADGDDVYFDTDRRPAAITGLAPLRRSARYGVYINVQQQLTGTSKEGKSERGLSVFANITQADRATSVTDNQVAIGLFYKGVIPRRPGDVLGLALARTNVNGRLARGQALDPANPPVQGAEDAAELYYSIHPLDGLELRPNLQWVHHPGGVAGADDVTVPGLKAAITL